MNYLKNKIVLILIFLILVISATTYGLFKNGNYESYEVKSGNLYETVTVSGKVIPAQEVDLSFELTSRIDEILVDTGEQVRAGDVLARLDTSEISNEIAESEATLDSEKAQLSELTSNISEDNQLVSQKKELLSVLKKAFITADDIVKNKVDILITDSNGRFPEFTNALRDYFIRQEINDARYQVGVSLNEWEAFNDKLTSESLKISDTDYSIDKLKELEFLLETISKGSTEFKTTPNLSQSQIDAYIGTISSARTTVAGLIVDINQSSEQVRALQSNIPVREAQVKNVEATLSKLNSRINKYMIVAPFDGVITDVDIKEGEISKLGEIAISIIGVGGLEIETFIPEILIAGVNVGDNGYAKLDAFSDNDSFEIFVAHVDPRETEKDGLTTYKTLVDFINANDEIRPGMSAEVEIIKDKVTNTLILPNHLIQEDEQGLFVQIRNGRKIENKYIEIGLSDGKGSVEVVSGLSEGEEILVPNQK